MSGLAAGSGPIPNEAVSADDAGAPVPSDGAPRDGTLRDDALKAVVARRRMCRDYLPGPLAPGRLERIVDLARRAPSAGFTQGLTLVSLERPSPTPVSASATADGGSLDGPQPDVAQPQVTPDPVEAYWDVTLPPSRRPEFPWPGLLEAPVLITLWVRPQAWVERYGRADKARSGLGGGEDAWSVPYWWVDAGAVVQNLLLVAEAEGLGALFFGMFDDEPAVAELLGVPAGWRGVGTVALGHPAPGGRRPSASARTGRPPLDRQWRRNAWVPVEDALAEPSKEA